MPKFRFAKLVRDKIVDHQKSSGANPHFYKLNDKEHINALILKIIEEAEEITNAKPEDQASEIADVQQALDDLIEKLGLTSKDIAKAQTKKNYKNGAFKKGLYVDYVEVDKNDPWIKYYRDNPDRYPEIK